MPICLRPALADEVDRAVPLIYSSRPEAFDFVFGDARQIFTHHGKRESP